jgi:hypothetical protein
MTVELSEKDVLVLIDLINCDIREVEKGMRTLKDSRNQECLCLIESLKDRITMLEGVREKLQNVK